MKELRVFLNQVGLAIELHGVTPEPALVVQYSPATIEAFGRSLGLNLIGDSAAALARHWFRTKVNSAAMVPELRDAYHGLVLSPHFWSYDPKTQSYRPGRLMP